MKRLRDRRAALRALLRASLGFGALSARAAVGERGDAAHDAMHGTALDAALGTARDAAKTYPDVVPGIPLRFPRDHGAHASFRTEWWYLTGWLRRLDGQYRGQPAGVQVTFFRTRTQHDAADPSRFAPLQLVFAHAALALPERGSLLAAQRAAREGFGLAFAKSDDTDVAIGDWSLRRDIDDVYRARIADAAVAGTAVGDAAAAAAAVADASLVIDLSFTPHRAPVLQGDEGFSRKGPLETQASHYYSRPQLAVAGTIGVGTSSARVDGIAWLDHEWSSEILDPHAEGWDWVGLNLDDGSAWMAFRIRRRDGSTLWSDARFIAAGDDTETQNAGARPLRERDPATTSGRDRATLSGHADATLSGRAGATPPVRFEALRHWTSPRTGARYPVSMRLTLADRIFVLEPLFDDQELDTRATTGVVYWEGAMRVVEDGRVAGRGYLELTGYHRPMKL